MTVIAAQADPLIREGEGCPMARSSENHPRADWNHPIPATTRPALNHPMFIRRVGAIIRFEGRT
jgi:hypothetical protein